MASKESAATANIFRNAEEGGKVVKAVTEFAWNLYRKLCVSKPSSNVFLSPASISVALAMTYMGARGETAAQMREVLKLSEVSEDQLHATFSDLVAAMNKSDAPYTLHTANRLYGQTGYNFLQEFLKDCK